jgi:hypothetical protein
VRLGLALYELEEEAMTMETQVHATVLSEDLATFRNAQTILTAAIQHAKEESLDPAWRDQILGLRLRLEKTTVSRIGQALDQMESSR